MRKASQRRSPNNVCKHLCSCTHSRRGKLQISRFTQEFSRESLSPHTCMVIIGLDYVLRTVIGDREGLTLIRRRSTRHPARHLSDLGDADDIALFADTIQEPELLLHKVESAFKTFGLFLNPSKTKNMHI